jgi:alanine racemase
MTSTDVTIDRSWLEIDLDAITANTGRFRELGGGRVQVFAVVKADGYGHGAVEVSKAALAGGATRLAVADVREALELRRAGLAAPVHILGAILPAEVDTVVEHGLIASVHGPELLIPLSRAAVRQGKLAVVHLKIDSGMGRLGIFPREALSVGETVRRLPGLHREGVYTHVSQPDDAAYTLAQLQTFDDVCRALTQASMPVPVRHAANSRTALCFPSAHYDALRPGLGLYGLCDDPAFRQKFPLRPALSWRTLVVHVKSYPPGHTLGYNRTFTTTRWTRVALLPVGYADGYRRSLSNRAQILVHGKRAPVIGMVSMDWTMADVSDMVGVEAGSVATLVGADGEERITIEDLASWMPGVIPYEIVTTLGGRNVRRYGSCNRASLAA